MCEDFPTHTALMWFHSSFLAQIPIWSKTEVFSTLTTLFTFTESLYHMTSVKNETFSINDLLIDNFIFISRVFELHFYDFYLKCRFSALSELFKVEYKECSTRGLHPSYY